MFETVCVIWLLLLTLFLSVWKQISQQSFPNFHKCSRVCFNLSAVSVVKITSSVEPSEGDLFPLHHSLSLEPGHLFSLGRFLELFKQIILIHLVGSEACYFTSFWLKRSQGAGFGMSVRACVHFVWLTRWECLALFPRPCPQSPCMVVCVCGLISVCQTGWVTLLTWY